MEKLLEMTKQYATQYWNDSCSMKELAYAIKRGATGATSNPVIVKNVVKAELDDYKGYINTLIKSNSTASEDDIVWMIIEKLTIDAARLLEPIFDSAKGTGRISVQTHPKYFNNAEKMVEQAIYFTTLAKNIQVKVPVTSAGIKAIEEATYRGVNINATISYSVAQAIAVAEAVERGLKRRETEGLANSSITPVCTLMIGRVDDWLKLVVSRDKIVVDPEAIEYAGVAVMKKAYSIYKQRDYKTKLLGAAFRNHHHWSAFIGGDLIMTMPHEWQKLFNDSDIEVKSRIDEQVQEKHLNQLKKFPDFIKAYDENGMKAEEFDTYGMVNLNFRQFLTGYDEFIGLVRSFMITY